jgi:hypothetical protein
MNGVMSLNGSCKHEELRSNNFRQRIPVLLWCLSFGHILLRAHSGSLSPRARFGASLLMEQINPMIVEGQIIGGVVHGIGNALFERMSYDDTAQPVSRSGQAARHRGDLLTAAGMATPSPTPLAQDREVLIVPRRVCLNVLDDNAHQLANGRLRRHAKRDAALDSFDRPSTTRPYSADLRAATRSAPGAPLFCIFVARELTSFSPPLAGGDGR